MPFAFDPGALLAHLYSLPRGPQVRLRLPRPTDAGAVRELFDRAGLELPELELARLTRVDPRSRIVICATALVDGRERVVGIGAIELPSRDQAAAEPDRLVVDAELTEGLDELLRSALLGRAQAITRARAA
jgi:hypothetical protein